MKKVLIIVGVVIAAIVAAGLLLPTLVWDGGAMVRLDVQLIEQNSSRSVRDARIWVVRSSDYHYFGDTNIAEMFRSVVTDERGRAEVSFMCGAGGGKSLLLKTGGYVVGHELIIEAPGYRRICTPLANVLGKDEWPLRKRHHSRKLWMIRDDRGA